VKVETGPFINVSLVRLPSLPFARAAETKWRSPQFLRASIRRIANEPIVEIGNGYTIIVARRPFRKIENFQRCVARSRGDAMALVPTPDLHGRVEIVIEAIRRIVVETFYCHLGVVIDIVA